MTSDASFWDQAAKKYAASPIKDQATYEHTLAETRKHLKPLDDLLEIGCGTGGTALLLADAVAHITATDISANMIKIGAEKAAAQEVANVDFVQATPADPKLAATTFDAIAGFNILHLLPDLESDLAVLRERLKPGGLLISKTPCIADWKWRAVGRIAIPIMQFFGKAPYVSFLKGSDVEAKIAAAGFEIVTSENHNTFSRFIVAKKL
ncbi:class I SAM-dependent methyltransferase [Parvibaculaceae bacterium PLY_AMNH_Bact1]|nr:class I SAM-dependent methyltransferase [Parvibaculaceae bacterium PLY_AMNH_Bact1]